MRDGRTNYVLVGGFVLAMLVALVLSIGLISGRTGSEDSYSASYENVAGLKYGSKVLYEGFAIGQVDDIEPRHDGAKLNFTVHLAVKKDWPIPEDSVARIAASGLLAALVVDIRGGSSPTLLKPGAQLRSQAGGNLFSAMADIAAEVTNLSQTGLRPLVDSLNRTVASLGPVLEQRAPQLLDNLLSLSSDLADKTPRISANLEQMSHGLTRVFSPDNTRKIDNVINGAEQAATNLADLTGSLRSSKSKVDEVLSSLDKAVGSNSEKVSESLGDLRYSLQAVSRNIDSITFNLEGTARNMNEFSREIRQNPGLLLGGTKPGTEVAPK
ncbi:MAG TPA: MCE family protein [Rhodospirillaceae bacterium]|nr:MCE family protein [Rhodospirillaceae bacterium]